MGWMPPSLYRRPNIASANRIIEEIRAVKMGTLIPTGRDAPLRLADALQKGQHVAMLVDQYFTNGVDVTFFGRKTKANPTLARLLRQIECPDSRRPDYPPARSPLPRRIVGGSAAGSRRFGADRRSGNDAGDYLGGRRLDPRIPRPVAVAASPLAMTVCVALEGPRPHPRNLRRKATRRMAATLWISRPSFGTAQPRLLRMRQSYRPVFTRVHNRLMTRWVAGSRAVMTNSFASIAWSG